jgi:MFS family permease
MKIREIQSKNVRYHIIEGALYLSTASLISSQTVMPALIKRLGGNDVLVGTWPVVAYLAFFLPQIISANYSAGTRYRKPIVIFRGFIQRINILLLACVVAIWGASIPILTLALLFILFIFNQVSAGLVSPIWMDFFTKTTLTEGRGRVIGWRASFGALIGLLNGFILTLLLTVLSFPYNYASVIGLAFLYQMSSLVVQNKIIEASPSIIINPVRLQYLFSHARSIIKGNQQFRKFLYASTLPTISFSAVAFFTVAAMKRLDLSESIVGIFAIVTIIGQIFSGVCVGWIADLKGTKSALIVCGVSLILSIIIAIFAQSLIWFCFAFVFMGVNIGAELSMRYNYAVECAPEEDRSMYVGIMNTWFAPFYLITPFAGWLSASYGYDSVFIISLLIAIGGIILLIQMPESHMKKLALSSK